jgi:putative transposase
VLAHLAEAGRCSVQQADEAVRTLKISRAMVYRLLARFKKNEETTSLLPGQSGRQPGGRLLPKEQERIIDDLIRQFYLSKQKPSIAALHRVVALECFNAQLPSPSYNAIHRRIALLDPKEVVRAREGARTASERFRLLKPPPRVTEPLDLVQIDHTLMDIMVVDEGKRKPMGRPWLSIAICCHTQRGRVLLVIEESLRPLRGDDHQARRIAERGLLVGARGPC